MVARLDDGRVVTGITLIVATADGERFRTALMLALAHSALGGCARIFLQERAVALLAGDDAENYAAAGLPGRAAMLTDALEAGVTLIGCQSGLALLHAEASAFDARIQWAGMVSLLQTLGEDRLLVI